MESSMVVIGLENGIIQCFDVKEQDEVQFEELRGSKIVGLVRSNDDLISASEDGKIIFISDRQITKEFTTNQTITSFCKSDLLHFLNDPSGITIFDTI